MENKPFLPAISTELINNYINKNGNPSFEPLLKLNNNESLIKGMSVSSDLTINKKSLKLMSLYKTKSKGDNYIWVEFLIPNRGGLPSFSRKTLGSLTIAERLYLVTVLEMQQSIYNG